jgi:hypothetical protein
MEAWSRRFTGTTHMHWISYMVKYVTLFEKSWWVDFSMCYKICYIWANGCHYWRTPLSATVVNEVIRPRHSWSGYSLASHCGGLGSRSGLVSGICGVQNGVRAGFLRVLRFPLPKPFHSTNFSILTITQDRYNRPSNGHSAAWTQYELHLPLIIKKKMKWLKWFYW